MKIHHFLLMLLMTAWISINCAAQTPALDSLRLELNRTLNAEMQKKLIFELCQRHYSLSPDSLLKFISIGRKLVKPGTAESILLDNYYCTWLLRTGKQEEAVTLSENLLKQFSDMHDVSPLKLEVRANYCRSLIRNSRYREAMEQGLQLLRAAEQVHDTNSILNAYNSIGWTKMELGQYDESISWMRRAVDFPERAEFLARKGMMYSNLASDYNNISNKDSALYFIERSIDAARRSENLNGLANALNIRAAMHLRENNFNAAEKDLTEALTAREKTGDKVYILADMAQLSSFYNSIEEYNKGIDIAKQGIELAGNSPNYSQLIFLYETLAINYKMAGKMNEYTLSLEKIISLKDTMYIHNSAESLAELQTRYDLEKKEHIIAQQENTLKMRNYIYLGSVILFLLITVIGVQFFISSRNRQKRLALQQVADAKEIERRRIAAELHDNIGTQLSYISRKTEMFAGTVAGEDDGQDAFLADINLAAHKTISDLRETIWTLKREEISLQDLADRLKVFTRTQLSNHPEIEMLISEELKSNISFTSIETLNIFRICQETVYNAIRHASATVIELHFSSTSDGNFMIAVKDNGRGFSIDVFPDDHFGIENMKERAAEINAVLDISSDPASGTIVSLHK